MNDPQIGPIGVGFYDSVFKMTEIGRFRDKRTWEE
jgi:hypothetical protein